MFKRIIATATTAAASLLISGPIALAQFAPQGGYAPQQQMPADGGFAPAGQYQQPGNPLPMPGSNGQPASPMPRGYDPGNFGGQWTPATTAGIPATVHQVDGNTFHYAVPAGWQAQESPQGVGISSPDHAYGYGLVMLPGVPANSPEQLVQMLFQSLGVRDLQFSGQQPQNANGMQALIAMVSFTGTDGQPRRGVVNACLGRTSQGNAGFVCFAASLAQQWDSQGTTLVSLASQIMPRGMMNGGGMPGGVPGGFTPGNGPVAPTIPGIPQTPGYGPGAPATIPQTGGYGPGAGFNPGGTNGGGYPGNGGWPTPSTPPAGKGGYPNDDTLWD